MTNPETGERVVLPKRSSRQRKLDIEMGINDKLRKKRWVSYKAAMQTARDHGVTSKDKYMRWHKKYKPIGIPRLPNRVYPEWTSWNAFLGTQNMFIPNNKQNFWSYAEAMKYAHKQGWHIQDDFRKANAQGKLPTGMPKWPDIYYKDKGWVSWPVFLGKTALARIEGLKVNISILAICEQAGMPGGYITVIIKDTVDEMKRYLAAHSFSCIKAYNWEPERKQFLHQVLSRAGILKNEDQNLWLIRNLNDVISDLDQDLLVYRG